MEDTQYYIWILVKYDGCKNIFLLRYEWNEGESIKWDGFKFSMDLIFGI